MTGASGLLGKHLLPLLCLRGHSVMAVSRRRPAGIGKERVSHVATDLLRDVPPKEALEADALVHLAWETTPGTYWTSADNSRWREASQRLVERFIEHGGGRVLVTGTCAEYCWDNSPCVEGVTPLRPASPYAAAKVELHSSLQRIIGERPDASLVWARVFFPYGPGEAPERLLPYVINALLRGEAVECSEGRQRRDYIHAHDVALALATLVESPLHAGTFNISSGNAVPVRDIIELCRSFTNREGTVNFGAIPMKADDPEIVLGCNKRLRSLGWRPELTLEEGIRHYCASLQREHEQRAGR